MDTGKAKANVPLETHGCGTSTARLVVDGKQRRNIVTCAPRDTVYEALSLMAEHNVGALIVVDGGRVVGVISERDYARKVILIGKASRETAVAEIMSAPAVTVGPGTSVSACMELMTTRHIRHLPVLEGGVLVGCVSIGDVVRSIIEEQGRRIGEFEAYVSGNYPT